MLETAQPLDWQMVFGLLFLILGPFAAMTQGIDAIFQRQLARRAFLLSVTAVAIAAGLGRRMLASFAIPLQVAERAAPAVRRHPRRDPGGVGVADHP